MYRTIHVRRCLGSVCLIDVDVILMLQRQSDVWDSRVGETRRMQYFAVARGASPGTPSIVLILHAGIYQVT